MDVGLCREVARRTECTVEVGKVRCERVVLAMREGAGMVECVVWHVVTVRVDGLGWFAMGLVNPWESEERKGDGRRRFSTALRPLFHSVLWARKLPLPLQKASHLPSS